MSNFYPGLYASPFHVRTAERNVYNAWVERGIYTLPRHFGSAAQEANALRFSAVLADLTAFGRLRVYGPGAARLLTASCKSDLDTLPSGLARRIFWANDGGGVRGNGIVARFGEENFVLESFDTDADWFGAAAQYFDAKLRNERAEKSSLLLAGPFAAPILEAAELKAASTLKPEHHEIYDWNGLSLTVSRRSALGGFELGCSREDGVIMFDRLMEAGQAFGVTLIGQDALELLYLEAGLPLAGLDYMPARDIGSPDPDAATLGFAAADSHADSSRHVLAGIEWDGPEPASFAPLYRAGREVGRTLRSGYSPALKRIIALANVPPLDAAPGTELTIGISSLRASEMRTARIVPLPFLGLE